ncbi:MAG: LacI family DNA-binding transcriptional regulator [Ignavibacteriales bacterium]|nr:LacI family DNA-binding transcriptional regulator [Ignavibacteriales bacterium]
MNRRITVKHIAEELGISMMTVSRALNNRPNVEEGTKEKVLETSKRLGYIPNYIAKSLVMRKTQTIGVVVPEITHSFFPEAIRGIEEAAYKRGYQIMLTHSAEDAKREKAAIHTLASKRVDGLLISVAESVHDFDVYKHIIKQHGLPIVFFDRCVYGIGASCVSVNDEESSKLITEHLINLGYTKIAHLSGPSTLSLSRARFNGFKIALAEHKIKFMQEDVVESGFHEAGGYKAMMKLLERSKNKRPRAIVAVNDPAAFGAMKAIKEKNLRIPEDIAIVGFSDDIRAEWMYTPLTTVRQPAYEVGKRAAEKLIAHIENKTEIIEEISVHTEQIIRKSCGWKLKGKHH